MKNAPSKAISLFSVPLNCSSLLVTILKYSYKE
jgi:hypothetical protein